MKRGLSPACILPLGLLVLVLLGVLIFVLRTIVTPPPSTPVAVVTPSIATLKADDTGQIVWSGQKTIDLLLPKGHGGVLYIEGLADQLTDLQPAKPPCAVVGQQCILKLTNHTRKQAYQFSALASIVQEAHIQLFNQRPALLVQTRQPLDDFVVHMSVGKS